MQTRAKKRRLQEDEARIEEERRKQKVKEDKLKEEKEILLGYINEARDWCVAANDIGIVVTDRHVSEAHGTDDWGQRKLIEQELGSTHELMDGHVYITYTTNHFCKSEDTYPEATADFSMSMVNYRYKTADGKVVKGYIDSKAGPLLNSNDPANLYTDFLCDFDDLDYVYDGEDGSPYQARLRLKIECIYVKKHFVPLPDVKKAE